jgi:hypothetical protein
MSSRKNKVFQSKSAKFGKFHTKFSNKNFKNVQSAFENLDWDFRIIKTFYATMDFDNLLVFLSTSKKICRMFRKHAWTCEHSGNHLEFEVANKNLIIGPWIKFFENVKLKIFEAQSVEYLMKIDCPNVLIQPNCKTQMTTKDYLNLIRFSDCATITDLTGTDLLNKIRPTNLAFKTMNLFSEDFNNMSHLKKLTIDQCRVTIGKTFKPMLLDEIKLIGGSVVNIQSLLLGVLTKSVFMTKVKMVGHLYGLLFTPIVESITIWSCTVAQGALTVVVPQIISEEPDSNTSVTHTQEEQDQSMIKDNWYGTFFLNAISLESLTLVDSMEETSVTKSMLTFLYLIPNLKKLKITIREQLDLDYVSECQNLEELYLQSCRKSAGSTYILDLVPPKLKHLKLLDLDLVSESRSLILESVELYIMTTPVSTSTPTALVFFGGILKALRSVKSIQIFCHSNVDPKLNIQIKFDPIFHICSRIHMSPQIKIVVDPFLEKHLNEMQKLNPLDTIRLDYKKRITTHWLPRKPKVKFQKPTFLQKIAK